MFCPFCAQELPPNAARCPACGAPAPGTMVAAPAAPAPGFWFRARAIASPLYHRLKELAQVCWHAFKLLAANPAGNFPAVLQSLGEHRAMRVGLVFGVIFDLCLALAIFFNWPLVLRRLGATPEMSDYLMSFLWGAVAFAFLWIASRLTRGIFGGVGTVQTEFLIAGSALLPFVLPILVLAVFGSQSLVSFLAVTLLAVGYSAYLLYSGWTQLLKIQEARAAQVLPVVLLLFGAILKLVFTNLF